MGQVVQELLQVQQAKQSSKLVATEASTMEICVGQPSSVDVANFVASPTVTALAQSSLTLPVGVTTTPDLVEVVPDVKIGTKRSMDLNVEFPLDKKLKETESSKSAHEMNVDTMTVKDLRAELEKQGVDTSVKELKLKKALQRKLMEVLKPQDK